MRINLIRTLDQDTIDLLRHRRAELFGKIKTHETEAAVVTGGNAYTHTSWNKLLKRMDDNLEAVKEEQKVRFAKMDAGRKKEELLKLADTAKKLREAEDVKSTLSSRGDYSSNVPYSYLAKDGVIEYNGVTFVCDEKNNAICLGDMTNPEDVINIPLSAGGCLKVNRNNISELSKAIDMFSPEDIKRIMQAIALDAKIQQMKNEVDDAKSSLGERADAAAGSAGGSIGAVEKDAGTSGKNDSAPTKEQIALLFQDRKEKKEL